MRFLFTSHDSLTSVFLDLPALLKNALHILEILCTNAVACLRHNALLCIANAQTRCQANHVIKFFEGGDELLVVIGSLDILAYERPILLLHHRVVLAHVLHVVDDQAGLGFDDRDLQVLDAFGDVGSEMRF